MAKKKKEIQSKKYELNSTDLGKIGKGALIAGGGALLTYTTYLIPNVDFGTYTPLVVAVSGIIINTLWKFIRG